MPGSYRGEKDSNIKAIILIDIVVAAVIVIAIVVVMMGEFCGGLWLRPLSQALLSAREDDFLIESQPISIPPSGLWFRRPEPVQVK